MNRKTLYIILAVAAVVLLAGVLFMKGNSWLGYTDSAILYLAAVIGAGSYWIGSNCKKN